MIPSKNGFSHSYYRSSRLKVFCEKGVIKNSTKFTGKNLCLSLFFNKVADLRLATLLKKRLQRCFSVNFAKTTFFYRTPPVAATNECRFKIFFIPLCNVTKNKKETSAQIFSCEFRKFLFNKSFLQNTSGGLLLKHVMCVSDHSRI